MPENAPPRLRQRPAASDGARGGAPDDGSPEYAAQTALAAMLRTPERPLLPLIQEAFPGRDIGFHSRALQHGRWLVEQTIDVLHKPTEQEAAPVLLDRLCFAWRVLRQADILVWKLKKKDIPERATPSVARDVFKELLPEPLADPFLQRVLESLGLGDDARYLLHYWYFRRAKSPTKLPAPIGEAGPRNDLEHIRRTIWWAIRGHRDQYVQVVPGESIRVEFSHIVELVLSEMRGWVGATPATTQNLAGEIESELNRWLTYSRIEPGAPAPLNEDQDESAACQTAKAFIRFNELSTKLVRVAGSAYGGEGEQDARTRELRNALAAQETLVKQYAEENRRLEDRIGELEARQRQTPETPAGDAAEAARGQELRDVLTLLDSKYSFDALNSVLLGQESHLTIKSFVSHLFYSLRKKGFGPYPDEDAFDLSYESSGLFECDGFEVPPGGTQRVRVLKRGWALRSRDRLLPVRRARVVLIA